MMYKLYEGDCLEIMQGMEDCSIDHVITDPPYGLEFMGKNWDKGVPGVPFWEEALRVAKPGSFLLAFGGTRTYHRLVCAIEDAGWEIRDQIIWLYGQGFPKSHNISKAIDKKLGKEREVVGQYQPPGMDKPWNLKNAKDERTVEVFASSRNNLDITALASPEAQEWNGYGTALKPAWEPIIVAMKPIDGTFVNNALTHGLAGLNIDGCRVDANGEEVVINTWDNGMQPFGDGAGKPFSGRKETKGRWPANVILDEEAGAMLDEQTGVLQSGDNCVRRKEGFFGEHGGLGGPGDVQTTYGDKGGASRFFYCAKASKREKNAGLEGLPERTAGVKNASGRGYSERDPYAQIKMQNHHPTVKPLSLMRYLVRLVTSPSGIVVLDPFMGSGSTGCATVLEGQRFIGIDNKPDYIEIADRRIGHFCG